MANHVQAEEVVEESPVHVNKIAARVNEQVILESELEALYQQILQSKGKEVCPSKYALLQLLIDNKLLYIKAKEEALTITPEEVTRALNNLLQGMGSEETLVNAFGKSIEEIKDEFRPRVEEQLTVNKMQAYILRKVEATPQKVKQFFAVLPEEKRPYFSTEVIVRQIVKYVNTKDGLDAKAAKDYLTNLRETILNGKLTFAKAARLHSEDLSTAMNGGLLKLSDGAGVRMLADELPPDVYFAIETLNSGEVSSPQRFMTEDHREVFKLFFLEQKIPPHRANLTQDYHKIEQLYLSQARTTVLNDWLRNTRKEVAISIADDYQVDLSTQ